MSLEKALEANTAAVLALTESMNRFIVGVAEAEARMRAGAAPAFEQPAEKQEHENTLRQEREARDAAEAKDAKKRDAAASKEDTAPAFTKAAPLAATSTSLSYDDIKKPFLELAKRDLAAAQALIAEFGLKTLKDAKPEQYAEILTRLVVEPLEGGMA